MTNNTTLYFFKTIHMHIYIYYVAQKMLILRTHWCPIFALEVSRPSVMIRCTLRRLRSRNFVLSLVFRWLMLPMTGDDYGKSPSSIESIGKSTNINYKWAIFNSYVEFPEGMIYDFCLQRNNVSAPTGN